ncbi:methyltransferase-like protein 22 [Porites lutea]|uniref:methyltransferase-like protein 22 n=1 Tax=Porites lutea TaxID=51062 RepID=UPI003CC5DDFF
MEKIHKDEDGDLSPPRKHAKLGDSDVITIEHSLSTPMKDVGLQVWRGALLLSDFLVYNEERYNPCIALELGAGLGLCSIVLGRVAKKVFCTDLRENILRCCQNNITANSHLFKYGYDVVAVRKFDWLASGLPTGEGDFCWTKEDQEVLKNVTVVVAADVIYDDSLTDAFIGTFLRLMEANKQITLLLTIERRLNFTLEELAVTSPAYNYFLSRIKELETKEQRLSTRKLDIDFPNYLQYERVKELELWEIKPA